MKKEEVKSIALYIFTHSDNRTTDEDFEQMFKKIYEETKMDEKMSYDGIKLTEEVDAPNSVKIAINAKGLYSGEVKVYGKTSSEAMIDACNKAKELDFLIRIKNTLE